MTTPRLSVLDLSPIASGATAGDALRNTIDLARHVEALGYARVWLAEHHNAGALASAAPEVMIGQVAAATRTLRVGAGGVMLPNHSPLKVAEVFRLLHALFPGRIDLGLGRAPGTDARTAAALRRGSAAGAEDFPEQVAALLGYLRADDAAPRAGFATTIRAIPTGVPAPDVWILGSSEFGAGFAAAHGVGFAFAHHINPADAVAELRAYRARFRPRAPGDAPRAILALSVACAATAEGARDLAACADLAALRFARGLRDEPLPSVEQARAHAWDEEDRLLVEAHRGRHLVGTVDVVRPALRELARASGADELMVLTHVHDHAARRASYELLADALG